MPAAARPRRLRRAAATALAVGLVATGGVAATSMWRDDVALAAPTTAAATAPTPPPAPQPGDPATLGTVAVSPSSAPTRIEALQARLTYAGSAVPMTGRYDAATVAGVRHFQDKHRLPSTGTADPATVSSLQQVTRRGAELDPRCAVTGPAICIDKTQKVLRYVMNGRTLRAVDVNLGPERGQQGYGRYSITREGAFRVYQKAVSHVSTGYGTPMPYAMWYDGAEAIHFSAYFKAAGYENTSQGCATVRDLAALRWIYAHTPIGTPVVVHR